MARELPGMVNRVFTLAEFEKYLHDELKMGAWRPSMIVLHNTGLNPHWTKDTTPEQSLQLMKNSSVTWDAQGWKTGPHMEIGPNGLIPLASPLSAPGTHSPSWNSISWGIEMVGDFDKQPFTDLQRDTVVGVLKALYAFLGKEANENTFKLHKEDPHTTHKHCPGANCGDEATWLARINAVTSAEALLDLPHLRPVPTGTGTFIGQREALVLHAYVDGESAVDKSPLYAIGYGTQIYPDGTRVKAGDTCTPEQAAAWRDARIASDWVHVQQLVTVPLTDGKAEAILSWCYEFNVGSFGTSTFLKRLNAGDDAGAQASFAQWNKVRKDGVLVENGGLNKRRKMELALWNGLDPNMLVAVPVTPTPKTLPAVVAAKPAVPVAAELVPSAAVPVTPAKPVVVVAARPPAPVVTTKTTLVIHAGTPAWIARMALWLESLLHQPERKIS